MLFELFAYCQNFVRLAQGQSMAIVPWTQVACLSKVDQRYYVCMVTKGVHYEVLLDDWHRLEHAWDLWIQNKAALKEYTKDA